jgi:hypothetical protein
MTIRFEENNFHTHQHNHLAWSFFDDRFDVPPLFNRMRMDMMKMLLLTLMTGLIVGPE